MDPDLDPKRRQSIDYTVAFPIKRETNLVAETERALRKEQKEENQYGSCYNFLYQIDKLFEYAGE
jgi:hypothetical protein